MNKYKNQKTANQARQRAARRMLRQWCPVFKELCKGTDCVSFTLGKSHQSISYDKSNPAIWKTSFPKCDSPLVTGYIEMDGNFPC